MAYINQQDKARLAPGIKAVLKKHNIKGSIAIRNHMVLVVTLSSGAIDFGTTQHDVNTYHIECHYEDNKPALEFLKELKAAMMVGNHDNSDVMTDYFDVGWYIDINIGKWDKPYEVVAK